MRITNEGHVHLEEGDNFIGERQTEDNIWRVATFSLFSGQIVTIQRHFSTIGPVIFRHDGTEMDTYLDCETNSIKERVH